jgi:hypothetical protein
MMNLLQYIFSKLSEAQKPVYFEFAPHKAIMPYIVFSLPNSVDVESDRQDYTLQINIWDDKADSAALETLTSDIDILLHKLQYIDNNQFLKFERENRLMISDSDPSIKRRQLRYTVKQYERL